MQERHESEKKGPRVLTTRGPKRETFSLSAVLIGYNIRAPIGPLDNRYEIE
jgi:hypothetical protein